MQEITGITYNDERALFKSTNLNISKVNFIDGESPLKECHNINISDSVFSYKYPFWYCSDITATNCTWETMARAGVWYTNNMSVKNCNIIGPKNFRRCNNLTIENTVFSDAQETLWNCNNVKLINSSAKGDYFAMNCTNMTIDGFTLNGNYSFDGAKNITISNSTLNSKDAFWNAENITVVNCTIIGEYIGWNSKNLTFINCKIESNQGFCYIDNLVIKDSDLSGTDLAFEFSSVDATVNGDLISVLNPQSGIIKAEKIGELILEPSKIDINATTIECDSIGKVTDIPDYNALI